MNKTIQKQKFEVYGKISFTFRSATKFHDSQIGRFEADIYRGKKVYPMIADSDFSIVWDKKQGTMSMPVVFVTEQENAENAIKYTYESFNDISKIIATVESVSGKGRKRKLISEDVTVTWEYAKSEYEI
ncbi:hypothetical protein [Paenibacillus naphthalenovorans]|uniref:hypothetical protein n=1 Tax=Paenibacillus naphthalenovorans TaxID=162209 RepID=UPI003D2DE33F